MKIWRTRQSRAPATYTTPVFRVDRNIEGAKLSPDESDERSSLKDVVLERRLTASIQRINPWINDENLRKVVRDLSKTQYPNLIEANQAIWNTIKPNLL